MGNGPWQISRIALAAFLDGDEAALRAYLAGERNGPLVTPYFTRAGLVSKTANPLYKTARTQYASDKGLEDAFEMGSGMLARNLDPDVLRAQMARNSGPENDALCRRRGVSLPPRRPR